MSNRLSSFSTRPSSTVIVRTAFILRITLCFYLFAPQYCRVKSADAQHSCLGQKFKIYVESVILLYVLSHLHCSIEEVQRQILSFCQKYSFWEPQNLKEQLVENVRMSVRMSMTRSNVRTPLPLCGENSHNETRTLG